MASYVVMEPPADGLGAMPEQTRLIRDGFSWLAFLVSPLWLLWHRLWFAALVAFIAMGVLTAVGERPGFELAGAVLTLLVGLYFGLEGQGLRIAKLRRSGWTEQGVIEAADLPDAETRYACGLGPAEAPAEERHAIVPAPDRARPVQTGMALGLSHHPGRA
ncbi:DUF2628 domain-containing protein [Mesorhizobium sp. SP-1A]|uniref:DUF2628 domain-containing protein n=1 Tax=Mesorhizobium sp. SP-1A TaxID=3077840 RepID=UPI0028F7097B|nr:DUF2628 domain-containing protein [Mesorhizobium sp. SP-1A]